LAKLRAAHKKDTRAIDAAEAKLAATRKTLTSQTAAAAVAERKYAYAQKPLLTRTIDASGSRNGVTSRFLANIRILMGRGFTSLARNLMNQGGPEAETLAAQAVRSTKDARSLQSRLDTSAKLDAQAQALEDKLNGVNQPVWSGPTTTYKGGKPYVSGAVRAKQAAAAQVERGVYLNIGNISTNNPDAAAQALVKKQRDAIAALL